MYIDDSTEIVAEGSNFDGDIHALTCIVTLPEKLKDLLPFIEMEWVGPPGIALTEQNHIFISEPDITNCSIMTTLLFNPLKTNHAGLYRCILGISKPALAPFFEREIRHEVIAISKYHHINDPHTHWVYIVPCSSSSVPDSFWSHTKLYGMGFCK